MNRNEHIRRHKQLHAALDELLADWISETGALPSQSTVMELLQWSNTQTSDPSDRHGLCSDDTLTSWLVVRCFNIDWETDGAAADLPGTVMIRRNLLDIPDDERDDDWLSENLADFLSDRHGFLVKSFEFEKTFEPTIELNDGQLVDAIGEWLQCTDSDELARIAGDLFGGECFSTSDEDGIVAYTFTPNENYCGEFDKI